MLKLLICLLLISNSRKLGFFSNLLGKINEGIHNLFGNSNAVDKLKEEKEKNEIKKIIIKDREIDNVWKKNFETNDKVKAVVNKVYNENICKENELKLLISKENKSKCEYTRIFKLIKTITLENCKNLNEKNNYEDLSWEIKEFLVQTFAGKKDWSNLDFLIKNFKKKKLFKNCEKYLIIQIRDLYIHLLKKGFGITEYQINFISLLNYIKKNNKFEGFKSYGIDFFNNEYKIYIPFLLNFIFYIPKDNFKQTLIIKTEDILKLIESLKKSCNKYLESKNIGNTNLQKDQEKIYEIIELVFYILLIKNKLGVLGKEYFPDVFYKLLLKFPMVFKNLIKVIDLKGDEIFAKSYLNYNLYNEEIKNKIIGFLKKSIFVDIREKLINEKDSIYSGYIINEKKEIKKEISSIIAIYNNHYYFLKKVFEDKKSDDEIKNSHIKLLFDKKISTIKDQKVKTLVKEFAYFIFYDVENYLTKKYKKENNIHEVFVDILIGENHIDESNIMIFSKNTSKIIINNIIIIYKKIQIIKDKNILNNLYQNFLKILLLSLFKDDSFHNLRKWSLRILKDNDTLLVKLLDNFTFYDDKISNYIKLLSNIDQFKIKFNFKGIYNPYKKPKSNKNDNFYVYEIIGHYIFKYYIPNYHEIILNFTKDCKNFLETKNRIDIFSKIINENSIKNEKIKEDLNIMIEKNINLFLRRSSDEDEINTLQNCSNNNKYVFDINNEASKNIFISTNTKKKMGEVKVKTEKTQVIDLNDFDFRRRI